MITKIKGYVSSLPWLRIGLLLIICIVVFIIFRPIFAAINLATAKLFRFFGVDPAADKVASDAVQGRGNQSYWNPNYWKSVEGGRDLTSTYTDAEWEYWRGLVDDCQSFWGGLNMDRWFAFAQSFQSKESWSFFCYVWQQREGTNLASWMQSGWLFGVRSSMSEAEFFELDGVLNTLPETNG